MTKIIETPTLTTERLILRPRVAKDSPVMQEYFNNWNIIKHLGAGVPWPYPDDGSHSHFMENILPRIKTGEVCFWAICLKKDINHPIGAIEYRVINNTDEKGDRGFWLAEPYWNKGYMTEAVNAVNDFIFNDLKVEKIIFENHIDNPASRRIKEKTGSAYIRTVSKQVRGEERKTEVWELTAKNWKKFREKTE